MPTIHSVHYCFVDLNRKTILTLIHCAAIQFGHFLDDDDIGFGGTDHFFLCGIQSSCNKVLRWALFKKQNLSFEAGLGKVWTV